MFGLRIISDKRFNALTTEKKGYYGPDESVNEYLTIISRQMKGMEMPKMLPLSRLEIKKAYETIAPVMGVVNYIADAVGDMFQYFELRDLSSGDYIDKHWLIDLLRRPNDRYTARKFGFAWAVNKCLFGDAFVYAPQEVGADKGTVKAMYIIPGQRVSVDKGGYDKPFKGIKIIGTGEGEIDVEGKVFESFDYNLDDSSFYGTSRIAAAAAYLTVIDRAMNRQALSLKNGGAASIISPAAGSSVPPLPVQLDDMEDKLNKSENRNRHITTKLALDVHTLGDKPVDLGILESHKDAINALCFVFKLPVDLYLGQAKYENAKEAKRTVYESIAIPMAHEFAEDLLHYLKLDTEFELKVNTDRVEVLKDSSTEVLTNLEKMHATLNEMREANGYEPINEPYADKPILPMGVQFGNEAGFDISEE